MTILLLALVLPAATVLSLRLQRADGSSPWRAQVSLLSRLADGDATVVDLAARRSIDPARAATSLQIGFRAGGADGERHLGPVPAGAYRVTGTPAGMAGEVVVGRAPRAIAPLGDAPLDIVLPVAVNALVIRGADGRTLVVQPLAPPARRTQQNALRAMRYGSAVVFFMDDRVYPEADAFWVGGARYANVVLQAAPGVRHGALEIANAPIANRVSVVGAAQPFDRSLLPRETAVIPLVFDETGAARLQIESSAGFIPAAADPNNQDRRFLGVYVKVR